MIDDKDGELLSKGKNLQGGVALAAEEHADNREDGEDEFGHRLTLVTRRNVVGPMAGKRMHYVDFKHP